MNEIEQILRDLVKAIEAVTPHVNGMFALQQVRSGVSYSGPTYGKELERAKKIIQDLDEAKITVSEPKSRSCNLHFDCDEADLKGLAKNGKKAYHCRSEDCEDCFGC